MELWTAFMLGLIGSAHCAGMCGPLVLALPPAGGTRRSLLLGRLAYNSGRIGTYAVLGAVLGLIGKSFALAGLQRWVSLATGGGILIAALLSSRFLAGTPALPAVNWLKGCFSHLLRRRGYAAMFLLGMLNGLLPCGLVYIACASALAAHGVFNSMLVMVVFGLGTFPMMFVLLLAGQKLQWDLRFRLQHLIPASLMVAGALLILRGMALGIPYLSPALAGDCPACQ